MSAFALWDSALDSCAGALRDAIEQWPEFETGAPVNGAGMVEWFGLWRERAKHALALADEVPE